MTREQIVSIIKAELERQMNEGDEDLMIWDYGCNTPDLKGEVNLGKVADAILKEMGNGD